MAKRKKTSLAKFKNMTSDDIKHLRSKDAQKLLKDMRELYEKRAASLEKRIERGKRPGNKTFYSPAYENTGIINKKGERTQTGIKIWYEKQEAAGKINDPYSTRIADAKAELSRLHDFFNAKTSTVKGAEKVMKNQDIRIFGTDAKGRPKETMTREERDFFWSVFNEFSRSDMYASTFWAKYKKNQIEGTLGKLIISKRGDTTHAELSAMMEELKKALDEDQYEYDELTSITGEGSDF